MCECMWVRVCSKLISHDVYVYTLYISVHLFHFIKFHVVFHSWRQHPTKQLLYGHVPPVTKIRRTRHAGHCREVGMYSCGPLHMDEQRQDVQLKPTYSSSVLILDVALRTCQKQWTIGRGSERGSEISVLIA